jgi:hypothetical protein
VACVGGVVAIYALSSPRPRDDEHVLIVGARRNLLMVVAIACDGVTSRCRSLVEGVPMMALLFEMMDSVPPPQSAPLGGLASCKLLW